MSTPTKRAHLHHCPECYEVHACYMDCSIEPDLEDEVVYPGFEFGAHCVCDKCKPQEYNQDFWDIYNGFKKRK